MGLLSKTLSLRKKEKKSGEGGGLLSKALEYSEAPEQEVSREETEVEKAAEEREEAEPSRGGGMGLLERAEVFKLTVEDTKMEEAAARGLLEKAQALQGVEKAVPKGQLPFEEEEGKAPEFRIEEGVRLEESEVGAEMPGEEEILQKELEPEVSPEEKEAITEATAEIPVQKKPTKEAAKTFAELLDEYLQSHDSIRLLQTFDEIVRKEGYSAFIAHAASMCLKQGKGKSVLLYLAYDGRYSVEYFSPESSEMKKIARKSMKKDSEFAYHLSKVAEPVRSSALTDDGLSRDTTLFEALEPWTALPLQEGAVLLGFYIIGNQPKKPRLDSTALELSARLSTGYLSRYVLEKSIAQHMEKAQGEKRATGALFNLYSMSDQSGTDLIEAFETMCRNLDISSAVLTTGWEGKGKITVQHSIGMTEKLLKKYKIQKKDPEMRTLIHNRLPSVPKDAKKRIAQIAGEKSELIKTYITAPVLFGDELLGVVIIHRIIHRMKAAGLKISTSMRERIEHGVRSLIPYFLDWKIRRADPFGTLASLFAREIEAAHNDRSSIHFILFSLETEARSITPQGLGELALKIYDILQKYSDTVKRIDLFRTLLLVRDMEDVEVDEIIKKGKNDFKQYLSRKKLAEAPLLNTLIIRYPQEYKNAQDILYRVYGVK